STRIQDLSERLAGWRDAAHRQVAALGGLERAARSGPDLPTALGLLATAAFGLPIDDAFAHPHSTKLEPRFLPQAVANPFNEPVGTIVVAPRDRYLYLIESRPIARRYGIGVGKAGLAFRGTAIIERKAKWPAWRPTVNMIKRDPKRYTRYAGGVPGGPGNPLGSRALYLYRDGRDTLYRIHGTTEPWTIGQAVSNGCVRMVNEHVEDLFERVPLGTRVVVV
ncbi:MAG TPA: L,D-transpeptidase, partial [Rhodocyclaceae bacterium]|nr:L,D-transpeptidase [Rhodocyclaceae bacterium]